MDDKRESQQTEGRMDTLSTASPLDSGGQLETLPAVTTCVTELFYEQYSYARTQFGLATYKWLIEKGYVVPADPMAGYIPTEKGLNAGFLSRQKNNRIAVVCSPKGKPVLRDGLEEILEIERELWKPLQDWLAVQKPGWFVPGQKSLSLTAFLKAINEKIPQNFPCKLRAVNVNLWLLWKGLLKQYRIPGGTQTYTPTEAGNESGILTRHNSIIYDTHGQQFILDNLENIAKALVSCEVYYKEKIVSFVMTDQFRQSIQYQPNGCGLGTMREKINDALVAAGFQALPERSLYSWMYDKGYIVMDETEEEGRHLLPTSEGLAEIGYELRVYKGINFIYLNELAQRFFVDHLEEIYCYSHNTSRGMKNKSAEL